MGVESSNEPENIKDLLSQLKKSIANPQELFRIDPPFVIPAKLKGLGSAETSCYESPARAHKIEKKDATTYEYTMRGVIPLGGHDAFVQAFTTNVNAFLSESSNYVVGVTFGSSQDSTSGVGVGIGGKVAGVDHKGDYIARLTVTFTVDTPASKKPRVTKMDAKGVYVASDPVNHPDVDISAQYEQQKIALNGHQVVGPKTVAVQSQKALFAFGYKLTTAAPSTTPAKTQETIPGSKNTFETPQGKLVLGSKVERLSSEGATCLPVLLDGVQVGSLVKCEAQSGRTTKADFISAKATPQCFDKDSNGNYFPNPTRIATFVQGQHPGKTVRIATIATGPCFQSYNDATVTGVARDNGVSVGHETSFASGNSSYGKGVAYMIGGQMTLKHSGEAGFQIPATAADVVTMSSLARIDRTNPSNIQYLVNSNASLRNHTNAHSMVSFADGKRGELIINGCTPAQKQAIVTALVKNAGPYQIERALYADADAPTNFLDGIFVRDKTTRSLRYSHPNSGDLFRNPDALSGEIVKNNMPGVMVYYAVQQ